MPIMSESVPIQTLDKTSTCKIRLEKLRNFFKEKFKSDPQFFVRAPGRVNLIGEHIDYCGYSVLPMALEQDILLAVRKCDNKGVLRFCNMDSRYLEFAGAFEGNIQIDRHNIDWWSYVLCGIKGVMEHHSVNELSLEIACSGNIPPQAGLSSSSAVVCASAMAISYAENLAIGKKDIANLCAQSEKYVGTEGGGMDQAISMLASGGTAKLIEFNPLTTHEVILPEEGSFVIAHCMAEKNKAASSDFNIRVVECRLAAQLLAKLKGCEDWVEIKSLSAVQRELDVSLEQMIAVTNELLSQQVYSKSQLCKEFGFTEKEIDCISLTENTRHVNQFNLRHRALHVFSEAKRVLDFKSLCDSSTADDILESLGHLMYESHTSCRDLYECSHPDLDELVDLSRNVALGARMTGAGWGGCIIALVNKDRVVEYCDKLKSQFYGKKGVPEGDVERYLFVTSPGHGAHIID